MLMGLCLLLSLYNNCISLKATQNFKNSHTKQNVNGSVTLLTHLSWRLLLPALFMLEGNGWVFFFPLHHLYHLGSSHLFNVQIKRKSDFMVWVTELMMQMVCFYLGLGILKGKWLSPASKSVSSKCVGRLAVTQTGKTSDIYLDICHS